MTDIEQIKQAIARAEHVVTGEYVVLSDGFEGERFRFKLKKEDEVNSIKWLSSLLTTIESLQEENRRLSIAAHTDVSLGNTVCEMHAEIESQKEEIERYNELFQEIGIMCAFDQPPQILQILAVLKKFQQEGDK